MPLLQYALLLHELLQYLSIALAFTVLSVKNFSFFFCNDVCLLISNNASMSWNPSENYAVIELLELALINKSEIIG